jgi:hypothetical protein
MAALTLYAIKLLWQRWAQARKKVCRSLQKGAELENTYPLFHRVESAQHNHNIDYYKGEASKENSLVIL